MSKKVSVITTTFQDLEHLKEVVKSIEEQDYDNLEYIIVDGGSKDGTKEYLHRLETSFAAKPGRSFRFISEPDEGIYDAINKGIKMANGDIIGVMFDRFSSDNIISRMAAIMETENTDGVHGDLEYVDADGGLVRHWEMGKDGSIKKGWMPAHPTLYLKKEVYEKYGVYKTDYKIAADYEFMVRILKDRKVKLSYIHEVLVYMFYGGTSTGGFFNYVHSFQESVRALKENHVSFAFIICIKRTFRVFMQFGIFGRKRKKG